MSGSTASSTATTDVDARHAAPENESPVLPPAKEPIGLGPLPFVGGLLAVLVIVLGIVAIRDALLAAGAIDGEPWVAGVIESVDGWTPQVWIAIVGAVAVLIGLWLLLAAFRPRPRTSLALTSQTGVFLGRRDVERVAVNAASDVDGVLDADASVARRKIDIKVSVTGGTATLQKVTAAVEEALGALESVPKVRVRSTDGGRT